MDKQQMAAAFNEWMRRYTENPEAYEREFKTVGTFLADKADGREPTYGETCAAYLQLLGDELAAGTTAGRADLGYPAAPPQAG